MPMPKGFLALLILSIIACCIEVEISVPSFPDMKAYFNVSDGMIQMTVAINFLGFCLGGLFYGPLSECFGRRKVMVIGNFLLLVGAAGCVFAPTLDWLLVSRFIQGIGASTSAVVIFAMIADTYQGDEAARLIGIVNSVITILMAISPVTGAFINDAVGWWGNYSIVALICLISWVLLYCRLPETKKDFQVFNPVQILRDYKKLLTSSKFVTASLVPSLLCSAYMSFVACASFLYIETFELSTLAYAINQALIVGVFSVVSLFSGKLLQRFGARGCIVKGMSIAVLGSLLLVVQSYLWPNSPNLMTVIVIIFGAGFALCYPVIFASSLEVFPDIKGTASSAVMCMRSFIVSVFIGAMSYLYNGTPLTIALVMFTAVFLALILTLKLLATNQIIESPAQTA